MDILSVLKDEHRKVSAMFDDVKACEPHDEYLSQLARSIEKELTAHSTLEERLFYPRLRDRAEEADERVDVFEAYTEHDVVKHLLQLLRSTRRHDEKFKAELLVLGESVRHHVREEESTIFSMARDLLDDDELNELGERWETAKARLTSPAGSNGRRAPRRKQASQTRSTSTAGRKRTARKRARR